MTRQGSDVIRSQDGRWEWDGQAWRPASQIAPAQPVAPPPAPATRQGRGQAVASLVLGIASLIVWLLPIVGLPVAILGLALGVVGAKGSMRGIAIAGTILSVIGLVFAAINAAIGAYLGATGQLHVLR